MTEELLNKQQYFFLTKVLDQILRDTKLQSDIVAIDWLHVLNEHPYNLRKYKEIFRLESKIIYSIRIAFLALKILGRLATTLIFNLFKPKARTSFIQIDHVDVLFVSQLISLNSLNIDEDFYFGNLPKQLASRGISSLLISQNQTKLSTAKIQSKYNRVGANSRILLPSGTSLKKEVLLWFRAIKIAGSLLKINNLQKDKTLKKITINAAFEAISRTTVANLHFKELIKDLCARYKPRNIVVLWEGHAWERIAFQSARSINKSTKCIAYQHTILFPNTHGLVRAIATQYDPDVMFTIGDINREILIEKTHQSGIPVITYGSHRRVIPDNPVRNGLVTTCLVIPDGIESECVTMFDFTVQAALKMPATKFILRTHPIIPYFELARRYKRLKRLPENVQISKNLNINDDFLCCDYVLYRGSSSVIHAILAGLRPLYLKIANQMKIDPLYMLEDWRLEISEPTELKNLIYQIKSEDGQRNSQSLERAQQFCNRYIVPIDVDIFTKYLNLKENASFEAF